MKVTTRRTFLKGVINGKRESFEKGKVYDVSPEEYHKYKVYGLRPEGEEEKPKK